MKPNYHHTLLFTDYCYTDMWIKSECVWVLHEDAPVSPCPSGDETWQNFSCHLSLMTCFSRFYESNLDTVCDSVLLFSCSHVAVTTKKMSKTLWATNPRSLNLLLKKRLAAQKCCCCLLFSVKIISSFVYFYILIVFACWLILVRAVQLNTVTESTDAP